MKLYEITSQIIDAMENLEKDGFDAATIADTMDMIETEFEHKAVDVIKFSQNVEADIEALKTHEKNIAARRKVLEGRVSNLKEYLRINMERTGIKKIECPEFTITLRKASEIVVIDDVNEIPQEYVEVQIDEKVNKNDLKKALKEGSVPGCHLGEGKSSILIK